MLWERPSIVLYLVSRPPPGYYILYHEIGGLRWVYILYVVGPLHLVYIRTVSVCHTLHIVSIRKCTTENHYILYIGIYAYTIYCIILYVVPHLCPATISRTTIYSMDYYCIPYILYHYILWLLWCTTLHLAILYLVCVFHIPLYLVVLYLVPTYLRPTTSRTTISCGIYSYYTTSSPWLSEP